MAGARAVAAELLRAGGGVSVLTGGTDVHLVLCDLRESELDGKQAEDRLHAVGITVNRNAVPFDPRPPAVSCGLRIGTPALATRGLQVEDFVEVGRIIAEALAADDFEARRAELADRAAAIAERYPLYAGLGRRSCSKSVTIRDGAVFRVDTRGRWSVFRRAFHVKSGAHREACRAEHRIGAGDGKPQLSRRI